MTQLQGLAIGGLLAFGALGATVPSAQAQPARVGPLAEHAEHRADATIRVGSDAEDRRDRRLQRRRGPPSQAPAWGYRCKRGSIERHPSGRSCDRDFERDRDDRDDSDLEAQVGDLEIEVD